MLSSLRALSRVLLVIPAVALVACGSYETKKVKDYRMHVANGTPEQVTTFKALIDDFNGFAGENVLRYVDDANQANSAIVVTKDLKKMTTEARVGQGQWLSDSEQDNPIQLSGSRPKRTVRFSMRVEFDLDYMFTEYKTDSDADVYARQKLFFHEVGHGLELGHASDADTRNVMHKSVSGDKDFDAFFKYVRNYMSDT